MIQRCKIILVTVFVVIFITGCEDDTSPNYKDINNDVPWCPWWYTSQDCRKDQFLKELLIETQETNAILKRIEDRLDRAEYGN